MGTVVSLNYLTDPFSAGEKEPWVGDRSRQNLPYDES